MYLNHSDPQFPPELLDLIVDEIGNDAYNHKWEPHPRSLKDLRNLALVSKRLNTRCRRHLFRVVHVAWPECAQDDCINLWSGSVATLTKVLGNPDRPGRHTKVLKIQIRESARCEYEHFANNSEGGNYDTDSGSDDGSCGDSDEQEEIETFPVAEDEDEDSDLWRPATEGDPYDDQRVQDLVATWTIQNLFLQITEHLVCLGALVLESHPENDGIRACVPRTLVDALPVILKEASSLTVFEAFNVTLPIEAIVNLPHSTNRITLDKVDADFSDDERYVDDHPDYPQAEPKPCLEALRISATPDMVMHLDILRPYQTKALTTLSLRVVNDIETWGCFVKILQSAAATLESLSVVYDLFSTRDIKAFVEWISESYKGPEKTVILPVMTTAKYALPVLHRLNHLAIQIQAEQATSVSTPRSAPRPLPESASLIAKFLSHRSFGTIKSLRLSIGRSCPVDFLVIKGIKACNMHTGQVQDLRCVDDILGDTSACPNLPNLKEVNVNLSARCCAMRRGIQIRDQEDEEEVLAAFHKTRRRVEVFSITSMKNGCIPIQ